MHPGRRSSGVIQITQARLENQSIEDATTGEMTLSQPKHLCNAGSKPVPRKSAFTNVT
jgi:hypothetical protein